LSEKHLNHIDFSNSIAIILFCSWRKYPHSIRVWNIYFICFYPHGDFFKIGDKTKSNSYYNFHFYWNNNI